MYTHDERAILNAGDYNVRTAAFKNLSSLEVDFLEGQGAMLSRVYKDAEGDMVFVFVEFTNSGR